MSEPEPEITEEQVADAQADEAEPTPPPPEEPAPDTPDGEPAPDEEPVESAPNEEPSPEEEPDEPVPPPSSPPPPSSEDRIEQATKALGKAAKAYAGKVLDTLGPELDGWVTCELCRDYFPGIRLPSEPNPETKAALRVVLGMPALDNFEQDPDTHRCPVCNGKGSVKTGSDVPQYEAQRCGKCGGKGFVGPSGQPEPAPVVEPNGHAPVVTPAAADDPPDFDPWGRPRGDPDYYRMPIPGVSTVNAA